MPSLEPWLHSLTALDFAAFGVFLVCWIAYEPLIAVLAARNGAINIDMKVIRGVWMRQMARGDSRLTDANLMGHVLNSASFFASSNLILIAAVGGVLFGGEEAFRGAASLVLIKTSSRLLFETKLAVVLIALSRGLLDFIWSIRQLNYTLTVIGAAPLAGDPRLPAYGDAAAELINPALSAFNAGVRGYYFSLAAATWLFGDAALALATLGATGILAFRQIASPASHAIKKIRALLETPPPSGEA